MPAPLGRPAAAHVLLSDIVLNPTLWRFLLFAGQPFRAAIAANVFVGRSLRSLALELLHRLNELVGWLYGRVRLRRLRCFERRYFLVRRWHGAAAAVVAARGLHLLLRRWADQSSGRAQRRRDLQARMLAATEYR
jgi:hypothetical protein